MSSHYETESGSLVWLFSDGTLPSNTDHSLFEKAMRRKMLSFIEHEVDWTTFAKPGLFFGDLQRCKRAMVTIASGMGFTPGGLMCGGQNVQIDLKIMHFMCGGQNVQKDLKVLTSPMKIMVSTCENIVELTSQMKEMLKKDRQVPNESCEIQERLNVSNTSSSELGECSFNRDTEILDQIQNQNASYILYLPFTREMCIQLNRHLIEAAKCHFVTQHRGYTKQLCLFSRRGRTNYRKKVDLTRREIQKTRAAANWQAEHARSRATFLTRAGFQPPQVLRVIDIEATCRQGERVVLIDYQADDTYMQQVGYTAISHTYGMDVYEVFDCPCATECASATIRPRFSDKMCRHELHQDDASSLVGAPGNAEQHKRVVNDILKMCDILRKAEVKYAWHDGVCIAQHDNAEVEDSIKHMGWIYASAKDTVVFLHYVGNPMAPIRSSNDVRELCCRWHTRVWTLQEGALSKCRRYCVRVGPKLGDCQSLEEFEEKLALWYGDDSSTIEIMEEERFFEFVEEIYTVLGLLNVHIAEKVLSIPDDVDDDVIVEANWMWIKADKWYTCTYLLITTLMDTCFQFPTMQNALRLCCDRDSKHRGDKINSILALAEVKDFVAHKDENVEASTIEFFKRQGQLGLATAVFSSNLAIKFEDKEYITKERQHTWPPILWRNLATLPVSGGLADKSNIGYKVLEDGRMEMRGELICVKVRFTVHQSHKSCEDIHKLVFSNDLSCLDMDLTRYLEGFKASTGDLIISVIQRSVLSEEIRDGDNFHAYLVFVKRLPTTNFGLVVQGRLDAHVSKVGVFQPTQKFLQMVCHHPAFPIIKKLIII